MKKEIPLHLIKIVEKFIHDNSDIISNHLEDNCIYCLRDKDPNSNFYYKILKQVPKHVQLTSTRDVIIEKRPENEFKIDANFAGLTYDKLQPTLSKWVSIIREYDNVKSVFDDPILNKYQKEFYDEFKVIDEDANYAPFNTEQLLFLEEYLDSFILGFQDKKEIEQSFKDEIIKDAEDLKAEITINSKNEVMKKLTSIWAKIQKKSLKYTKEFILLAKEEFMKMIIRKGLNSGTDIITNVIDKL